MAKNAVDLLMGLDAGKALKMPEGEYEVKRLTEMVGEPFIVRYRAVPGRKQAEIIDQYSAGDGEATAVQNFDSSLMLLATAVFDPDLNDEGLKKKFGAATPKDLAEKLFLTGEVNDIVKAVTGLSKAVEADQDKAIKN